MKLVIEIWDKRIVGNSYKPEPPLISTIRTEVGLFYFVTSQNASVT